MSKGDSGLPVVADHGATLKGSGWEADEPCVLLGSSTSPPNGGEPLAPSRADPPPIPAVPDDVVEAAEAELQATWATPNAKVVGAAVPVDGDGRRFRVANPTVDLGAQPAGELYLEGPGSDRIRWTSLVFASHDEIVVTVLREPQGGPFHLYRKFDAVIRTRRSFVDYLSKTPTARHDSPHCFDEELTDGQPGRA